MIRASAIGHVAQLFLDLFILVGECFRAAFTRQLQPFGNIV
jgi:hypothetical protein